MTTKANVYEVFDSIQGEGPYVGTRQVFVRFQGCPLTCVYCDSTSARPFESARRVTCNAMRSFQNPVSAKDLAKLVESLWNPAIKYLSLTGGEPLLHTEFILELADEFFGPLYLETNAMFSREAQRLKHAVHVAACDVKLPEHRATATYDLLLREELRTIECFHNSQAHAFAKVVVLKETLSETIELVAQRLATIDNNLLLVLQPVTPLFKTLSPDNSQLLRLMDAAAVHLNQVRVIPQMHRLLGIA